MIIVEDLFLIHPALWRRARIDRVGMVDFKSLIYFFFKHFLVLCLIMIYDGGLALVGQ